jgi:hypothetical protein
MVNCGPPHCKLHRCDSKQYSRNATKMEVNQLGLDIGSLVVCLSPLCLALVSRSLPTALSHASHLPGLEKFRRNLELGSLG